MSDTIEFHLQAIVNKIMAGNVALFLGAGCSISAGLPDGRSLTTELKKRFPACSQELEDFMDVCQDIIETPPYNEVELHDFVRSKIDLFDVSDTHKKITRYPWSAIFTTNYDTLIETAYNTSKERLKSCYPVVTDNPSVNISDRTKTYLFKIMGTVDAQDSTSAMVLTRTDYHSSIQKRNHYLRLLADYIKSGTIIYIGYSFKDQIVKDIISSLSKLHGFQKIPYSYVMLKGEVPSDLKSQYFFSSNKLIPLSVDFDQFFKNLDDYYDKGFSLPVKLARPRATIKVLGKVVSINEDVYNMYASSFFFLHEELFENVDCTISEFLNGKSDCLHAYLSDWDFKRTINRHLEPATTLAKQISEELKHVDPTRNKILFVSGMPGCGKTVFTYRTALDIYLQYSVPVLIFNKNTALDFKTITSFAEDVNNLYERQLEDGAKSKAIKIVLVFDDVSSNLRDVLRLNGFLESRGRSALIIINARHNELESQASAIKFKIDNKDRFHVGENFTVDELRTITDYLYLHGFIPSKSERWTELIQNSYGNSIFATFYSLVHPSRKPLEEIIRDQFEGLSEIARDAYIDICCFSQFNLPINIELLVRSLNVSYEEFQSVLKGVEKIIFEECDYHGNMMYKAHHSIIAEKTIEFFIPDRSQLFAKYKHLVENCLLYNNKEKQLVELLLIENFSTKGKSTYFTLIQQRDLFIAACTNSQSRSILHHLALIEMELEQFEEAEWHLLDALELPKESSELYKGESDQNILTSLGKLNSILGNDLLKANDYAMSAEKFAKAEEYFKDAKHGDYPNSYAYHANAYMWFQKFKNDIRPQDRISSVGKALEIINLGKDNLNSDEVVPLLELETDIFTKVGDEDSIRSLIENISVRYNIATGYFIYANFLYRKGTSSVQYSKLYYDQALKTLNDALSNYPKDEKCLTLKCKILVIRGGVKDEELYDQLSQWSSIATSDNAMLQYHFARLAFILTHYDQSRELFDELEAGVGMGSNNRSKTSNPIIDDETGEPKVFAGIVNEVYSKMEGAIRVNSFSSKIVVNFRPISSKFNVQKGASVKFNIAFSYRGPFAVNVIKD